MGRRNSLVFLASCTFGHPGHTRSKNGLTIDTDIQQHAGLEVVKHMHSERRVCAQSTSE